MPIKLKVMTEIHVMVQCEVFSKLNERKRVELLFEKKSKKVKFTSKRTGGMKKAESRESKLFVL